MSHYRGLHVCSFSAGVYDVRSPAGKISLTFDDSEQFGPSKFDMRTGDLSEISERHRWFWEWYPGWVADGRPIAGEPLSTPLGPIHRARGPA